MNYTPQIGDLVTRPKVGGIVNHVGVVVGPDAVAHNTPGKGEHLSTLEEFAAGQPVTVHPTGADQAGVLARACSVISRPKPYNPFWRNCQHTVSEISVGVAKSSVVVACCIIAALGLAYVLFSGRRA